MDKKTAVFDPKDLGEEDSILFYGRSFVPNIKTGGVVGKASSRKFSHNKDETVRMLLQGNRGSRD